MSNETKNYGKKFNTLADFLRDVPRFIRNAGISGLAAVTCLVAAITILIRLPFPSNVALGTTNLCLAALNAFMAIDRNPRRRRPKHRSQTDLSNIVDITAESLYKSATSHSNSYSADLEKIWAEISKKERKLYKSLDEAALAIAEGGRAEMRIVIQVYDWTNPNGDRIKIDMSDIGKGEVAVKCYNFKMPHLPWRKPEMAFSSIDEEETFAKDAQRRIAVHFDRPYFNVESSYGGWPRVTVRWLTSRERDDLEKAVSLPGGYEAYKAGVPVEDIVA